MNSSHQLEVIILAAFLLFVVLTPVLAGNEIFQSAPAASSAIGDGLVIPPENTLAYQGYKLFVLNCAHCHGTDARGDEGPDLHGVTRSDARIASMIKNGVKGEMPKFGAKLTDADVKALIAFVRSLKD